MGLYCRGRLGLEVLYDSGVAIERTDWMPHRFSFASTFVNRSIIGTVYLAVLLIFFAAQMLFTAFLTLPPLSVFLLVVFASSLRLIEIFYAEKIVTKDKSSSRRFAISSIAWTLVL